MTLFPVFELTQSLVSFQLQTTESHLINYNPNALVDCKGKVVETEVRLLEATPEETGTRGAQLVFEGNQRFILDTNPFCIHQNFQTFPSIATKNSFTLKFCAFCLLIYEAREWPCAQVHGSLFAVETLDARGNMSALNRFDFSVTDFVCDEGASLSYTVRPRMSPGVGEMEGWDPNFSPQAEAWEKADFGRTHLDILLTALRIQLGDLGRHSKRLCCSTDT